LLKVKIAIQELFVNLKQNGSSDNAQCGPIFIFLEFLDGGQGIKQAAWR